MNIDDIDFTKINWSGENLFHDPTITEPVDLDLTITLGDVTHQTKVKRVPSGHIDPRQCRSAEQTRAHWRDVNPEEYLIGRSWKRSYYLEEIIRKLWSPSEINYTNDLILEVGCGVLRNLIHLWRCGWNNVAGYDTCREWVDWARTRLPCTDFIRDVVTLEDIPECKLIFTMATLSHIHPDEINSVVDQISDRCDYVLTVEDERSVGTFQWPRNYRRLFEDRGLFQTYQERVPRGVELDGYTVRAFGGL